MTQVLAQAADAEDPLLISAVNWGEIVYMLRQKAGKIGPDEAAALINSFPIDVVPADRIAAEKASAYKIAGLLSYADSFAAALTHEAQGELLTADRGFETVKDRIKIIWL